jgi:hypothetical protein
VSTTDELVENGTAKLNQPWRGFVAAGEVVLAAAAVIVGILCWQRGVTTMVTPLGPGQAPLVTTIFYADWMAAAIGLVLVATLLLLDALRQLLLAVRTRRRPAPPVYGPYQRIPS